MLYKKGTRLKVDGGIVDMIIVNEDDVEKECNNGWFLTSPEALDTEKELTKGEKMALTKAKNKAAKEAAEKD